MKLLILSKWILKRGGCIIRSRFLGKIKEAFDKKPNLANLLFDDYFKGEIKKSQKGWRNIVAIAAKRGIPAPAFSTALAFFDSFRSAVLPANLLQAQRDFFGAHTYERVDKPRGEFFHTNWTGHGGSAASTTYTVYPRLRVFVVAGRRWATRSRCPPRTSSSPRARSSRTQWR